MYGNYFPIIKVS